MFQQRAFTRGADTIDFIEGIDSKRLRSLGAMCSYSETMRFITQPLYEIEDRVPCFEHDRMIAAGNVEMLAPGVAVGALGDADQLNVVQSEARQDLARYRELSQAAVNQDEVGAIGEYLLVRGIVL